MKLDLSGVEAGAGGAQDAETKALLAKERKRRRTEQAVRRFDHLADAAGVDVHVVAALCDCAVSTVWERARRDEHFPKPRTIGGSARWNVRELRELLQGEPA
jgi:predicted DNA-binding transcriptional regulator AlpA